jgi:hypothetical protein
MLAASQKARPNGTGIAETSGWWHPAEHPRHQLGSNLTDPTCSDILFAEFLQPFP